MTLGFRQILSGKWVPRPFYEIAAISTTMFELCAKHAFMPERFEEEGLGWVRYFAIELADGTRFFLEWGEIGPSTEITINAAVRDPAYDSALKKLLSALTHDPSVILGQTEDGHYDELLERQRELRNQR